MSDRDLQGYENTLERPEGSTKSASWSKVVESFSEPKMTKIELGKYDAAIIFKENGDIIQALPEQDDQDFVHETAYNALRCAVFIKNARLVKSVDRLIKQKVKESKG